MLFATLGKLDFLTVVILLLAAVVPQKFLLFAAVYLILKGGVFIYLSRDFASYGDFVSGIYLLVLSTGITIPVVHSIILFWLIQKTALTFIAIGLKAMLMYYEHKEDLPIPDFLR